VEVERIARQFRVGEGDDIVAAPEGATLLHAEATVEMMLDARSLRFAVLGSNLTNANYREYTSLLRYYADQPGRDIRVRLSADF
jgi:outer membrane receptor protein involved in Fe transport